MKNSHFYPPERTLIIDVPVVASDRERDDPLELGWPDPVVGRTELASPADDSLQHPSQD